MQLNDPNFDKSAFIKKLETTIYLMFVLPLAFFGYAFLEREANGELRSVFYENPDLMFHTVMAAGIGYVLMRTLTTWKKDALKVLKQIPELDMKLIKLRKSILYRNLMWSFGGIIGAFGLYEKGDMVYALVFSLFLVLITANRPSPKYFANFFGLKGEERKWMEE
tara:strand:+ start:6094 stop:6588 length:495 start_codon:yes stop_codon:yes gene_type:complete